MLSRAARVVSRSTVRVPAFTVAANINGVSLLTRRGCSTLKEEPCTLELIDGTKYKGFSFGARRSVAGEVVFNTGMVGYPESLTDPSYRGQMLVITYPLVGNYGVPGPRVDKWGLSENFESNDIHIRTMIISDYSHVHSHWDAVKSLSNWLKDYNVPGIYGVDTRAITKKIRQEGVMLGRLTFADLPVPNFQDPNDFNLINEVSLKEPKFYGGDSPEAPKVILVDVGVKNNIIRCLAERGASVKVVPWDYDFNHEEYDGLFVSNGPGAPWMASKTIEHMRVAMNAPHPKPIMGICLGNQLMALAAGAKTYKMQFGNRAQNVPCIDQETYRCYITPQNHGYAVDNRTLSPEWRPYFINANDGSNEGIKHVTKPFYSVQFHPEAEGGPYDTSFLFDHFIANAKKHHRNRLGWNATTAQSVAGGRIADGKRAYHTSGPASEPTGAAASE